MRREDINQLFFSRNHDFLHVYIPKQRNGSENTQATYRCGMQGFRSYINSVAGIHTNRFRFCDCTYDFLLDYRNYLHDALHLAESTCNNRIAVIKSYMNYVSARDISMQQYAFAVSQVPFYTIPKRQQPIIESVDSLAALLNMPPNTKKGLRDKVIMSILYDAGLRVEELVSIAIRDVNLDNQTVKLRILGKGQKERLAVLDIKTSALVRQYLNEYHPFMIPTDYLIYTTVKGIEGQMSTRNIQKMIKKYASLVREKYDLPDSVSPHTLRRTRGTLLYRDGVPLEAIARMLGHAGTQTTRDHYSSPSVEQMRRIVHKKADAIPDEVQLWPDDEDELTAILGL